VPKLGHVTLATPLGGRFMVPTQGGSVLLCLYQIEVDSSFRSKVIKGSQKLEIGSRDPGHAHLGVVLYSIRRRVRPPSLYEFEADCSLHSKVIKGVPKLGN